MKGTSQKTTAGTDKKGGRAVTAVNKELIDLYWQIGEHISRKVATGAWGEGTVEALTEHIWRRQPGMRGFSASNLWRMRQFYETYRDQPKLATLLRELSWTHNLAIMSRCKRDEEREFSLRLAYRERWSFRELQRQLNGALFERTVLSPAKLSAPLRELHAEAATIFKDSYLLRGRSSRPRGRVGLTCSQPALAAVAGASGWCGQGVLLCLSNT
jgi:predicted nuclease of restriction endonuclease-like (RecB) superfamily